MDKNIKVARAKNNFRGFINKVPVERNKNNVQNIKHPIILTTYTHMNVLLLV